MQKIHLILSGIFISLLVGLQANNTIVYAAQSAVPETGAGAPLACLKYTYCDKFQNKSMLASNVVVKRIPTSTVTPTLADKKQRNTTPTSQPQTTVIPTQIVTATPTSAPPTSTPPSAPVVLSSNVEAIFSMINNHRSTLSLPAFEKEERLCQLAASRGPELQNEANTGALHKGLYDRNLPYWITENMAYYQTVEQNMNFWLNSTIHRSAIEGNYRYSCGHCEGTMCIQLFTNFTPK